MKDFLYSKIKLCQKMSLNVLRAHRHKQTRTNVPFWCSTNAEWITTKNVERMKNLLLKWIEIRKKKTTRAWRFVVAIAYHSWLIMIDGFECFSLEKKTCFKSLVWGLYICTKDVDDSMINDWMAINLSCVWLFKTKIAMLNFFSNSIADNFYGKSFFFIKKFYWFFLFGFDYDGKRTQQKKNFVRRSNELFSPIQSCVCVYSNGCRKGCPHFEGNPVIKYYQYNIKKIKSNQKEIIIFIFSVQRYNISNQSIEHVTNYNLFIDLIGQQMAARSLLIFFVLKYLNTILAQINNDDDQKSIKIKRLFVDKVKSFILYINLYIYIYI